MTNDPACWQALANAVILQAAEDYREVCRKLRRRPYRRDAAEKRLELESFCTSRWFRTLSEADGRALLEKIRKEAML